MRPHIGLIGHQHSRSPADLSFFFPLIFFAAFMKRVFFPFQLHRLNRAAGCFFPIAVANISLCTVQSDIVVWYVLFFGLRRVPRRTG